MTDIVSRLRDYAANGSRPWLGIADTFNEAADAIERLQAELADLDGRCVRLLQAGRLLQANMLGCAQDHHSHDFAEQGMPGWLVDTQADIDAAQLYFERTAAIRQRTDDAGR